MNKENYNGIIIYIYIVAQRLSDTALIQVQKQTHETSIFLSTMSALVVNVENTGVFVNANVNLSTSADTLPL